MQWTNYSLINKFWGLIGSKLSIELLEKAWSILFSVSLCCLRTISDLGLPGNSLFWEKLWETPSKELMLMDFDCSLNPLSNQDELNWSCSSNDWNLESLNQSSAGNFRSLLEAWRESEFQKIPAETLLALSTIYFKLSFEEISH